MKSTIDILHNAQNVNLIALFAPEHGVRGDKHAGDFISDEVDAQLAYLCFLYTEKHVK